MKEVYLGLGADRAYIKSYLENIRSLDPIEITTLPSAICLNDDRIAVIVNMDQFRGVAYGCLEHMRRQYGVDLEQVSEERYYITCPPEDTAVGGFHDPRSLGYQYWYHASFVVALNNRTISPTIRTLEMVRNFLHDCLHHSTFRSYRRAMRVPARSPSAAKHRVPEVYREQYGINFRNKDGVSYSSPELTARSPEAINLNLLMDGIVVLAVSEALREIVRKAECENELEEMIQREIMLESFDANALSRAHRFAMQVTEPSRKFVEYWGKGEFMSLALQAMMTGDLTAIKHFSEERAGIENAWEKLFRQPDFLLSENPNI